VTSSTPFVGEPPLPLARSQMPPSRTSLMSSSIEKSPSWPGRLVYESGLLLGACAE